MSLAQDQIQWIEDVNTLHRQVEILYVVDGYEVTITWDGVAISEDFHGETVSEAIAKAMANFDLEAAPKWVSGDRQVQEPVDRQLAAVEAQRDQLLAALQGLIEINSPLAGGPSHGELVEEWESEKRAGNLAAEYHLAALAAVAAAKGGAA